MKILFPKTLHLIILVTAMIFLVSTPILASHPALRTEHPAEELSLAPATVTETIVTDESGPQVYIVKFADAPLATYDGNLTGLQATNIAITGKRKLDVNSPASQAYLNYLDNHQETFRSNAESVLDRPISYLFTYDYVYGGAAMELTAAEAAKLAKMDYVISISPSFTREIQTDAGPVWVGADSMWDEGYKGEGLIVGVIDTGVNPLNPSFADVGDDGYDHPDLGINFGVCDSTNPSYDATFPCNDKLIGAYGLTSMADPIDADGHGSHTASTAAGSVVDDAEVVAPTITISRTISGVAPHAHLITYRACDERYCDSSALLAGINQAVADGVDAINYSIGGGATDPWVDPDALAFLDARVAGVFVATSAGNDGPDSGTVSSPANAPWLTSVGNSTHNRTFVNSLIDMAGGDTIAPEDMVGKSLTRALPAAPIVYAGDHGNALCGLGGQLSYTSPWPEDYFNGEIVVCDRGTYGRVEKGVNLAYSGAGGYVLVNDIDNGDSLVADGHALPAVHLTYAQGVVLKEWLASGIAHTAAIAGTSEVVDDALGDIMASSSSRGENLPVPGVIKPDVTAPGTDILAAHGTDGEIKWDIIGGTSMASPHVAGAGILLIQAHPEWTPAQIQSALMLSGETNVLKEDATTAADPFDYGGGRIEIGAATEVGFVLDETKLAYLAANPTSGGDPTTLNIASLSNNACAGECSWTREISSTAGTTVTWTAGSADPVFSVEPASFTLPAGGMQTITVTATVAGLTLEEWYFGSIDIETTNPEFTDARFSAAIVPVADVVPELIRIETGRDAGSRLYEDRGLSADPLVIRVLGIEPDITEAYQTKDPTNVWPAVPNGMYDDLNQVYTDTFQVPANTLYLAVELLETTSPNLDLAIGYDVNGDGEPEAAEELAVSGSNGSLEAIFMTASELETAVDALSPGAYASGGTYWVLVMNCTASTPGVADYFKLATAAVDATDTTTDVYVETSPPIVINTPFDMRLFFDLPDVDAWYGIAEYYDDTEYQATSSIQIVRGPDDVIKDLIDIENGSTTITATFKIAIANNSSGEDWTYTLTDTLPSGLSFVPGSATGGATISEDTLIWTVDIPSSRYYALASSDTAQPESITYQVTAAIPGVYTNMVDSTLTNPGSELETNGGDFALTIPTITKIVDTPNLPTSGDIVTYTITAANDTTYAIPEATITDALPTGMSFGNWVGAAPSGAMVVDDTVSWIGDLDAGSNVVLEFTANIDLVAGPETITNTAELGFYGVTFTANAGFVKGAGIWLPCVLANSTGD